MDRETHEELKKLSKEAFGSSSRWRKLVEKGVPELYERDREAMILGLKGLEKKKFTDHKYMVRRYTVDEVRKLMTDLIEGKKGNPPTAAVVSSTPTTD